MSLGWSMFCTLINCKHHWITFDLSLLYTFTYFTSCHEDRDWKKDSYICHFEPHGENVGHTYYKQLNKEINITKTHIYIVWQHKFLCIVRIKQNALASKSHNMHFHLPCKITAFQEFYKVPFTS